MSLAFAIQRAAPYYQAKALGDAVLSGDDPFSNIPGFETPGGDNETPATGGLPPLHEMLKNLSGKSGASIDPGFNVGTALPPALAQAATAPNPMSNAPTFDPGPYQPHSAYTGTLGSSFNDLMKAKYDQLNFPHYAAPEGSELPFVGSNYKGDQGGYWYDPYTNQYRVNENSLIDTMGKQGAVTNQAKIAEKFGLTPKEPSPWASLGNTLLGGAGNVGGNLLTKYIFDSLLGGGSGGGGPGDLTGQFGPGASLTSFLGGGDAGASNPFGLSFGIPQLEQGINTFGADLQSGDWGKTAKDALLGTTSGGIWDVGGDLVDKFADKFNPLSW